LSNPSSASAKQVLAAFDSLVKKRLPSFPTSQGPWIYGGAKLVGSAVDAPWNSGTSNLVAVKYDATDLTAMSPGPAIVANIQESINTGPLECELKQLYPRALLTISTGDIRL
jgi:hypothetical protein